jgi:hypothetical protein
MRPQCCFSGHEPTALYEEKADANAEYSRHGVTYVTCSDSLAVDRAYAWASMELIGPVAPAAREAWFVVWRADRFTCSRQETPVPPKARVRGFDLENRLSVPLE